MKIREIFKNDVSKSAFKVIDGVTRIVGKYGEVEVVEDIFDVFIVGPNRTPLHGRRIASILRKLPENIDFTELNGEAWHQTTDEELVRLTLPLLGVRKKRKISEEQRSRIIQRIQWMRD